MESLGLHGIRVGERKRERERERNTTTLFLNLYYVLYMCVFNEHFLYKFEKD